MRPELVGAVHGAAELLPVSSGAHVLALAPGDHALAVAAHAGSGPAVAWLWRRSALPPRPALQLAALVPPVLTGAAAPALARRSPVAGLVAGSVALAVAARAREDRRSAAEAGWRDGLALGLAQSCALWPGVSRLGATFTAARLRGFAPEAALELAREVAVPVTLAAVARTAPALRRDRRTATVALASAAGALAAAPLGGRAAGPVAPLVAWRLALAAVLAARGRRDLRAR